MMPACSNVHGSPVVFMIQRDRFVVGSEMLLRDKLLYIELWYPTWFQRTKAVMISYDEFSALKASRMACARSLRSAAGSFEGVTSMRAPA